MSLSKKTLKKVAFLTSLRVSVILVSCCVAFLLIGIWVSSALLTKIFTTVAVLLFVLLVVVNIVWSRRLAARTFAHWRNEEKQLKDVLNHVVWQSPSSETKRAVEVSSSYSGNFFSPNYVIPHSEPVSFSEAMSSSLPNSSGDNQADIHLLNSLLADVSRSALEADSSFHVRKVITIISPDINDALSQYADLVTVTPMEIGGIDSDVSLIIIDENQFHEGQWSGVLTTQRTHIFQNLYFLLRQAKERRIPIVIYPSHFSSHYSEVLYSMADVLLQPSEKADSGIFIVDFFSEIMNGRS